MIRTNWVQAFDCATQTTLGSEELIAGRHPVLIAVGAGYIDSHAVLTFQEASMPVVVLDESSKGRCGRGSAAL